MLTLSLTHSVAAAAAGSQCTAFFSLIGSASLSLLYCTRMQSRVPCNVVETLLFTKITLSNYSGHIVSKIIQFFL